MRALLAIDHVQIAIPEGGETQARPFYEDFLGLKQVAKPVSMATRGGAWYESGAIKVHLGVEQDFRANEKAHVAFRVQDLATFVGLAQRSGWRVREDAELPGHKRAFVYDPFGNRIELLQPIEIDCYAED